MAEQVPLRSLGHTFVECRGTRGGVGQVQHVSLGVCGQGVVVLAEFQKAAELDRIGAATRA